MTDLLNLDPNLTNIIISSVVSAILSFLAKHGIDQNKINNTVNTVKRKEHQFRQFIDATDNAIYNDKIDETTFRTIYETGKALVSPPSNLVK